MSFLQLINQIDADKFEKEVRDDFLSRKAALGKLSNWSKKLALAAVPFGAIAAFAEPAKAQSTRSVTDVLNYALTLEYLEASFYGTAKESGVYVAEQATFDEITAHESAHVAFLQEALGADAVTSPTFDFTVGGAFDPFNDYSQFLLIAQAFEDTGVRAYKGQAGFLIDAPGVLSAALRIHSVEARHASAVRRIRGKQGWIPLDQPDAPDAIKAVYAGEANTTHAGVDVTTISNVSTEAITEAWDEQLSAEDVLAIAGLFIVS